MSSLSRRKFLCTSAGVAAIAGIGYLTRDYWPFNSETASTGISTATLLPHQNPQPTITEMTSPTEAPARLVDIELQLFHDYNGNGSKQSDEPAIIDAEFNVKDDKGNMILENVKGDSKGTFRLDQLNENRTYYLEFFEQVKSKYRCYSMPDENYNWTNQTYKLSVKQSQAFPELGLMVGFLTLPFNEDISWHIPPLGFFDLGAKRSWKGKETYSGHTGTDFMMHKGSPILSAAPGIVQTVRSIWSPSDSDTRYGGKHIIISHGTYQTGYYHLEQPLVNEGQQVTRGEKIGLCGHTGLYVTGSSKDTPMPESNSHLHFAVYRSYRTTWHKALVDPYRDLKNPNSFSLWTKDNEPQYPLTE